MYGWWNDKWFSFVTANIIIFVDKKFCQGKKFSLQLRRKQDCLVGVSVKVSGIFLFDEVKCPWIGQKGVNVVLPDERDELDEWMNGIDTHDFVKCSSSLY